MNDRFRNCLAGKNKSAPPIWFMRQAGRYHSHYQRLRAKHSFMDLCKKPELAAQVALGPIEDFDFDVAILFSDLLFPLEALGMGLEYTDQGPRLGWQLTPKTLDKITSVDEAIDQLTFQGLATQATRELLPKDKSLVGFVGGPWTLFVYACEGSHAGPLTESKRNLNLTNKFFPTLVPLLKKNIALQLEAGAEIVYVLDTAAGELSPSLYRRHAAPALIELAEAFPRKLGYYSRGTQPAFFDEGMLKAPWAGWGFDHRWNLSLLLSAKETPGFVQGNFDQALLFAETSSFKTHLEDFLNALERLAPEDLQRWVCGLGHGILPRTPEAHVKFFVERVRERFG